MNKVTLIRLSTAFVLIPVCRPDAPYWPAASELHPENTNQLVFVGRETAFAAVTLVAW